MAGEWRESTLGNVTDFLSGGTPSKSRADYWNGSIPWVSAKDMKQFRLQDTEDHVTEIGASSGTRLAPAGSVLLLVRGMTLLNDLPICIVAKPMTFNQDVKALRPNTSVIGDFLPYLILGNKDRLLSRVDLAGHGTGRLNSDELKALEIGLPPKAEQRAIAHILGTLDDKIELNLRRNQTLEAMARALFKDWFVDFGPVRAKMEDREPYLPADLWQIFPDRLDDEGKPEGWRCTTLASLASLNPESWTKKNAPRDIRYVDLSNTKQGSIEGAAQIPWSEAPSRAQRILRPGDTIVGTVRPGNKSFALIGDEGMTGSTGFAVLRPLERDFRDSVYLAATSPENIERLTHLADGAAYPAVRPDVVLASPITVPTEAVMSRVLHDFSNAVSGWLDLVEHNKRESQTVAQLRDTLLPKLISGELRIVDAEKFIDRIGM